MSTMSEWFKEQDERRKPRSNLVQISQQVRRKKRKEWDEWLKHYCRAFTEDTI